MNINWRIIIPIVLLLIYALELANKLMKMNMEKAIMVVVSLLLYISACCANVFATVIEIPDGHICSEDGLKSFW